MFDRLRAAAHWWSYRIGRRGTCLITLGWMYLFVGISVVSIGVPANRSEPFPHEMLPIWLQAGMWFATVPVAWMTAYSRRISIDLIGFIAVAICPASRVVSNALAWLEWSATGFGGVSYANAWSSATIWVIIMIGIMVVASWPEPRDQREYEAAVNE